MTTKVFNNETIASDILFLRECMHNMQTFEYQGRKIVDEDSVEYDAVFTDYYMFCACLDTYEEDEEEDFKNVVEALEDKDFRNSIILRFYAYLTIFEREYNFFHKELGMNFTYETLCDAWNDYTYNMKEILS